MLPLAAGREASPDVSESRYARRRPERNLLYQLIEEYYPALKADLAAQGAVLPEHVHREFADYLKCGRLVHGFFSCALRHLPHRTPRGLQLQTAGFLPQLRGTAQGGSNLGLNRNT